MNFIRPTMLLLDSRKEEGKSRNFSVNYDVPLQLDPTKRYVIGLFSSDIWYSWYNVESKNNVLRYYNGRVWADLALQPGAYNITDIDKEIKRLITAKGDQPDNVAISPNFNTLKCRITLSGGYKLDFTPTNSIRTILGFNSRILGTDGAYDGDQNVNITEVTSLVIRCSIVSGSYINGSDSDCIYSFSPNVAPGHLISIKPYQVLYVPISAVTSIPRITMRITDQSGAEVNLNGEHVTYHLYLKYAD